MKYSPCLAFHTSTLQGIGLSPRTTSWDHRNAPFDFGSSRHLSNNSSSRLANTARGDIDDEDDLDGTSSVAGTDLTELSEVTSGSLTSVD